ncbi:MAG: zinc-dependent metalloprotease [Acidobacteriota bacterium]|nr:zinc-dependent metalloprotease [Acidobacteriota bacterium]
MTSLPWIDWDAAEQVGLELVDPGPRVSRREREQIVTQLRHQARRAADLLLETSGLAEVGAARELVVDRRSIIRANLATARQLTSDSVGVADGPLEAAAGRARGATIGGVLAAVGTRILGQFDPFVATPTLYLVAPTILGVERELKVDPTDFRMWVTLHEQTHRVQFANAGWLRDHLAGKLKAIVEAPDEPFWQDLGQRLAQIRRDKAAGRPASLRLVNAFSPPSVVAAMAEITAVMSLLEGHADVMMDRAGRAVIPTVATIRARFDARRARGGIHGLINRLLGMDAKLAQYADGARFCRHVWRQGGTGLLNRAFEGPQSLPTLAELLAPEQWCKRMMSAATQADGQA